MSGSLLKIKKMFPETEIWMDSIVTSDIEFGLKNGSLGVTTAPPVTAYAVEHEWEYWKAIAKRAISQHPGATEREILWACMYAAVKEAAKTQLPLYDPHGTSGRFAVQANIYDPFNAEKMLAQADYLNTLGTNLIFKIPTTQAGLVVIEECVARGYNTLATSVASVPQAVAATEALERGYKRLKASGKRSENVCMIIAMQLMLQDTCIANFAAQNGVTLSADALKYGAIAVGKKAYRVINEKSENVHFMLSNFGTDEHLRAFMGGDIMLTLPRRWQDIVDNWTDIKSGIGDEVSGAVVDELCEKIPHYRKEYGVEEMTPEEFGRFPAVCRIFNKFLESYEVAVRSMRSLIIPDPYASSNQTSEY